MEEGAINKPHERRQKEKMTLPRSETFPSMSHPQRAASGQAINQQQSSSTPSFPTHLDDKGASFIQQQPYVSNLESDSLTNHRQVACSAPDFNSLILIYFYLITLFNDFLLRSLWYYGLW
jgi:hypothetical protein